MTVRFDHPGASVVVVEGTAVSMSWIDPIGALELGKERHQERLREAEMSHLARLARGAVEGRRGAQSLIARAVVALSPGRAAHAAGRSSEGSASPSDTGPLAARAQRRARTLTWPHPWRRVLRRGPGSKRSDARAAGSRTRR